jgi:hypothetical protein
MKARLRFTAAFPLAAAAVMLAAARLHAQTVTAGAADLLRGFEQDAAHVPPACTASCAVATVLAHPSQYPRTRVDSLLAGLESFAGGAANPHLRHLAAGALGAAGSGTHPSVVPGTAARMIRVYRRASDPIVRGVLVAALGRAAERGAAVAFLSSLAARAPADEEYMGAAHDAVAALLQAGSEGQAALRDIHQRRLARNPRIREELALLAAHGYRIGNAPPARSP